MSSPEPKSFFEVSEGKLAKTAIFVSGSGTNAEKILEDWQQNKDERHYVPCCIVTDRPERCRAREISEKYKVELVELDIFEFYKSRGLQSISLASEEGRKIREDWTVALYEEIKKYDLDFGIFAGFVPLCNITNYFPCLNVHPGDLTVCNETGERLLIGLHTLPVHHAFQNGLDHMRSSVIVAKAYEEDGDGMDEGHIIGISEEVLFDFSKISANDLQDTYEQRPKEKPQGGWQDDYQKFLSDNQEKLKVDGDWVVFPSTVADFAEGKFGYIKESLFYKSGQKWLPIDVIEYSKSGKEIFF
ncbi:MAG: hypothetical protein NE334_17005 [Lentisphaeraceae bacterium]|nr:hypothetical protein [Lentisphaeraceae bacterium]